MITSGPYEEDAPRKKEKPAPVTDPLKSASQAIERLAMIVTHVAQLPPPQINIPPASAPAARPKRLEAEIQRGEDGKMNRVVLIPIY